jgi:GT2 family glycosyltransferase
MSTKPEVSIEIVVKNDPGVERTLELLRAQKTTASFEVIVIDASRPGALHYIRDKFPEVRWVDYDQNGKKYTIPEQRNIGVKLAQGDVIACIDANCEPAADWLESLMGAIRDGEDIVGGPCVASNANNLVDYLPVHSERTYVIECTTINVALKRSVFERVGMFDENLSYGEDVDFFWRCVDAGYKLCQEPKALIRHDYGETGEQLGRAFRYGKARALLHKKHLARKWKQLLMHEPHVWMYPAVILTAPLAIKWPLYLIVLAIPVLKNRSLSLVVHHFVFGWGVIVGAVRTRF